MIAGLTAAAVVIPKAMAYATIAGLPVQVGLYTCSAMRQFRRQNGILAANRIWDTRSMICLNLEETGGGQARMVRSPQRRPGR